MQLKAPDGFGLREHYFARLKQFILSRRVYRRGTKHTWADGPSLASILGHTLTRSTLVFMTKTCISLR